MERKKKPRYVEKKPPDIQHTQQETNVPEEKPEKPEQKMPPVRNYPPKKEESRTYHRGEKTKYMEKGERRGKSDVCCIICSEEVTKTQSIWTCNCCCISLHLSCMREWIKKVNAEESKRQHVYSWKCPQCNH